MALPYLPHPRRAPISGGEDCGTLTGEGGCGGIAGETQGTLYTTSLRKLYPLPFTNHPSFLFLLHEQTYITSQVGTKIRVLGRLQPMIDRAGHTKHNRFDVITVECTLDSDLRKSRAPASWGEQNDEGATTTASPLPGILITAVAQSVRRSAINGTLSTSATPAPRGSTNGKPPASAPAAPTSSSALRFLEVFQGPSASQVLLVNDVTTLGELKAYLESEEGRGEAVGLDCEVGRGRCRCYTSSFLSLKYPR